MTDIKSINYQPLNDMQHAWQRAAKNSFGGNGIAVGIAVLIISIGSLFFWSDGAIYIVVVYAIYITYLMQKYKNQVWRNFGTANGWLVDDSKSDSTLLSPSLQYGHSQEFSPVIKANLNNISADMFSYNCTTGGGRASTTHYFTVAVVTLPKTLPHMLLLSQKKHVDVRENLDNHEKLQLEGDFNKYFNLQVPKGQEVDALSVITPDVMQTLISYNQSEDIEISGANLYFILAYDKRDSASIQSLIRSVIELTSQITVNVTQAAVTQPAVASPSAAN